MPPEERVAWIKEILLWVLLPAVMLVGCSSTALAASANGCHCFNERAYDPKAPFAADDYILTTTFNSLIARSLNLSKPRIVMLKMQGGVAGDDLLIGLRLAQTSQADSQTLFDRRKAGTTWPILLAEINPAPELAGTAWFKKLKAGGASCRGG